MVSLQTLKGLHYLLYRGARDIDFTREVKTLRKCAVNSLKQQREDLTKFLVQFHGSQSLVFRASKHLVVSIFVLSNFGVTQSNTKSQKSKIKLVSQSRTQNISV